eukprot:scaffold94705_cov69-Phaeocystis_antarctica.AAC.1
MFLAGVLALGRVLWWISTLHIQIRRPRDNFLHAGFLSPPVSDRAISALRLAASRPSVALSAHSQTLWHSMLCLPSPPASCVVLKRIKILFFVFSLLFLRGAQTLAHLLVPKSFYGFNSPTPWSIISRLCLLTVMHAIYFTSHNHQPLHHTRHLPMSDLSLPKYLQVGPARRGDARGRHRTPHNTK